MNSSNQPDEPRHEGWDAYWSPEVQGAHKLYAALASVYRRIFICTRLSYWLRKTFRPGAELLHAGCGGGQVDALVGRRYRITGLDISRNALALYARNNPHAAATVHADLLGLDLEGRKYDGAYNLGVMEHFAPADIALILANLEKVLKPGGRVVLFWPLATAPSVKLLGAWHRLLNRGGDTRKVELHPAEISLIESERSVRAILEDAGWRVCSYSVSPWDLFIQAVIVCEPKSPK